MTGFKSKKAAALDEEGMYLVHQTNHSEDILHMVAQPAQEPVAYLCENAVGHKYFRWKKPSSTYKPIPLYTTPPQEKNA